MQKNQTTRIGILGGIGPEATAEFYSGLIKEIQKKLPIESNKDFPQIIINSIPAPELVGEIIPKEELAPYFKGIQELDLLGVDFIAMICNTIHLFREELQEVTKCPIIDLRKEIAFKINAKKTNSILVLGAPKTVNKLYNFKTLKIVKPNKKEIKILSEAIFLFNKGEQKQRQTKKVKKICKKYVGRNAEAVLLGCTEIALMLKKTNMPKIDPMEIMIGSIINRLAKERGLKTKRE